MGSIFQASHCNSFQDWVNFIFGCLIFWMWQGMRIMMPVMVAGWHALLSFNRDLWYIRSSSTMSQWYHTLYWYCFDPGARFTNVFLARNSNPMETSPCHNSVAGHQIATNFCTCHDSTAVVPCTKFCSDHCIRIEVSVKRNFHRIWIVMENPLVKRAPCVLQTWDMCQWISYHCRQVVYSDRRFTDTYHYLNHWWLDYRRIYASLGLNALIPVSRGVSAVVSAAEFTHGIKLESHNSPFNDDKSVLEFECLSEER